MDIAWHDEIAEDGQRKKKSGFPQQLLRAPGIPIGSILSRYHEERQD